MSLVLEEREALLRSIFDSPSENAPRLIFADWLEDHGEHVFAELIRIECDTDDPSHQTRHRQLLRDLTGRDEVALTSRDRGFWATDVAGVDAMLLNDPEKFRITAAIQHPEWFGARTLRISAGRITDTCPFDTIYQGLAFRRLTRLDLSGRIASVMGEDTEFQIYEIHPVITNAGVDALARHRLSGRIEELILINNDLGNDALRFLSRSPYFGSLKRLEIREGHSFRGRVWQQIVERFGEERVS